MDLAFPFALCILQVIKNWIVGRLGNETKECAQWWMYLLHANFLDVSKTEEWLCYM